MMKKLLSKLFYDLNHSVGYMGILPLYKAGKQISKKKIKSVSSSSWGLGRAVVCDCGTTWTFLLPFILDDVKR